MSIARMGGTVAGLPADQPSEVVLAARVARQFYLEGGRQRRPTVIRTVTKTWLNALGHLRQGETVSDPVGRSRGTFRERERRMRRRGDFS
jgi:hypothetical protein